MPVFARWPLRAGFRTPGGSHDRQVEGGDRGPGAQEGRRPPGRRTAHSRRRADPRRPARVRRLRQRLQRAGQRHRPANPRDHRRRSRCPPARAASRSRATGRAPTSRPGNRAGRLSVVDLTTGFVVGEVATPRRPAAIKLSPDGARAYVVSGSRKLAVVDLLTLRVVKSLRVGRGAFDLAVHPDGGVVYVTNAGGRSVSVVATAALRVAADPAARRPVAGIAVSGNGDRAVIGPGRRSRKAIVIATSGRASPEAHLRRQRSLVRRLLPHCGTHLRRELRLGHGDVRERLHLPPPVRQRARRAPHQRHGRAVGLLACDRYSRAGHPQGRPRL